MIRFDANLLLGHYQAKYGLAGGGMGGAPPASLAKKSPTPPWSTLSAGPKIDDVVAGALRGRKFVDEAGAKLDVKGASEDYRKLFALHQALATLEGVAKRADKDDVSRAELGRLMSAFDRGTEEVSAYVDGLRLEKMRLTHGDTTDKARMSVGVPKTRASYVTAALHAGSTSEAVAAFDGDVKFDLTVKRMNNTTGSVSFDLAEMGATARTMSNVVKYLNDKLSAAGFNSRFAVDTTKIEAKTVEVNGKPVTITAATEHHALKIQGDSTETLTFSALASAPAVYLAQTVGDPDPDGKADTDDGVQQQQFLKFETGTSADAVRRPGEANWVDGQVFGQTLPEGVQSVRTTLAGADGSVYMLADVTGPVNGQAIKGERDVALMKFDSAGRVVYTRTLGASDAAGGLGLAVGADGRVAVTGAVTGALVNGDDGVDATKSDSFVTVFDAQGQELWTQRQGARDEDEAVSVAFAADGSLHVLGRVKGSMPGAVSAGGWDTYLRSFDADGKLLSSTQFGAVGDDKPAGLVVDGTNVVVASVEAGAAVLRRFDLTDPARPTLAATRNIGALGGGSIAGLAMDGGQLVVAGATGAQLSAGTVTRAHSGGVDAFAARISADLSSGAGDVMAYYGGAGEDRATALTVAGGKVWLTGASKGEVDGFVAELDVAAGTVGYSQRFTGKDQMAAPSSIAVDVAGASVLDRMGLPKGTIEYRDSQRVTAATAAREGDQFQIRSRLSARPVTITIEEADTLDTLADKVRRATGFSVRVEIISDTDSRRLQIRPMNQRSVVEIMGGRGGRDALEALGLEEGFVRTTTMQDGKLAPADGGTPMYGLQLARDLALNSKANIKTALDEISLAMSTIRRAYRDLEERMNPQAGKPAIGPPSAYMQDRISNYQAALARLTGGG